MPCSCGNTLCPCGIPCYCSEESCKCQYCAIALPRLCKVCNKPLFTKIQIDEDTCSCFLGESASLILENQDNPKRRLDKIPVPTGCFVFGKLVTNFMIPLPFMRFPDLITQLPSSLMPPAPSKESNHNQISFISDKGVLLENSDSPSTAELQQILNKPKRQLSDCGSSGYSSGCDQNAEVISKKIRSPPGFMEFINIQDANVEHIVKSQTRDRANIHEMASFYLPSVKISDISYPVEMTDRIWRLPNPAMNISGNPYLNLLNPFYVAGPAPTPETAATCENKFNPPAHCTTFGANGLQRDTESKNGYMPAESGISLKMYEHTLDPIITSEQPNLFNGENVEFVVSSNNSMGNECTGLPSSEIVNAGTSSEQISGNFLIPDQSQSSSVKSPEELGPNSSSWACSGLFKPANPISDNVNLKSTGEPGQKVDWCSPLPDMPLTGSNAQILTENVRTFPTSSRQPFSYSSPIQSSEENDFLQQVNSRTFKANPKNIKENFPLYVDLCAIQTIKKFLKHNPNLNVS